MGTACAAKESAASFAAITEQLRWPPVMHHLTQSVRASQPASWLAKAMAFLNCPRDATLRVLTSEPVLTFF